MRPKYEPIFEVVEPGLYEITHHNPVFWLHNVFDMSKGDVYGVPTLETFLSSVTFSP